MELEALRQATAAHIQQLYQQQQTADLCYHHHGYLTQTVERIRLIAAANHTPYETMLIAELAAWFHALGFLQRQTEHPESFGAMLAKEWLHQQQVPEATTQQITQCILAAYDLPAQPTEAQLLLHDAIHFDYGSADWDIKSKLLQQEMEWLQHRSISSREWKMLQLGMLEKHQYHTPFAQQTLEPVKRFHLEQLHKSLGKKSLKKEEEQQQLPYANVSRGVETMFRLLIRTNFDLTGRADTKANILISINTIIVSVLFTTVAARIDEFPYLRIPVIVMTVCNLSTIVLALLATIPRRGRKPYWDMHNEPKTDLLYFGNYTRMTREEYHAEMFKMIANPEAVYTYMMDMNHDMGHALKKTYRYLNAAYYVFLFGFVVSVILFGVALLYFK